jgi:hypothetical protein
MHVERLLLSSLPQFGQVFLNLLLSLYHFLLPLLPLLLPSLFKRNHENSP